jgi:hypothetical protein
MTSPPAPDRTGYVIASQGSTLPGKAVSYSVTRVADGVCIGAYFDLTPGGDIDQAIAQDRVEPLP